MLRWPRPRGCAGAISTKSNCVNQSDQNARVLKRAALALAIITADPALVFSQNSPASSPPSDELRRAAPLQKASAWYESLKGIWLGPGTLDVGANVRMRYEFTDNFNVRAYGTEDEDNLLLLRTRLSLDYHLGKPAHAFVEMQDARYWLSGLTRSKFTGSNPFYDEWELRQAFLEWEHIAQSPIGFKAGRQTISYADRRVFGPGEWGNVGRYWWDAAKLYIHTGLVKADILYGRQIISEPSHFNDEHFPYHMAGLYAQFRQFTNHHFSVKPDLFYIGRYDTHGNLKDEKGRLGDEIRHTLGARVEGKVGTAWDYYGTVAGQFGTYGKGDIESFGIISGAGYTFKADWSPRFGAEFCYASGDGDPADGVRSTFDNVYGAIDAYVYGWMNVVPWMNLEDYQMSFTVHPTKDLKVWVEYNYFRLADPKDAWYYSTGKVMRKDTTGMAGRDLGHEINLLGQLKVSKTIDFLAGYGCFLPGNFVSKTPGTDAPAHWVFTQLSFNL